MLFRVPIEVLVLLLPVLMFLVLMGMVTMKVEMVHYLWIIHFLIVFLKFILNFMFIFLLNVLLIFIVA